ncbi:MAG: type III restriction endonuclease subunit R, partial [Planctomycetes bacterium]|nr:type III restriction endonuclease subunit R [Planctomycetota bacterium]
AHWRLLEQVPNLDVYAPPGASADETARQKGSIVKDSLGNVMRWIRPMVVIDEQQRAYTETALATIDGFNPSFLLELSATPRVDANSGRGANILVDVRGTDLDAEQMIKLPINVDVRPWPEWQACLRAGLAKLDDLEREARTLESDTARYIRPILLVQVERTGGDQTDVGRIHADDARALLLQLGLH